jgi:hypothetical protein
MRSCSEEELHLFSCIYDANQHWYKEQLVPKEMSKHVITRLSFPEQSNTHKICFPALVNKSKIYRY